MTTQAQLDTIDKQINGVQVELQKNIASRDSYTPNSVDYTNYQILVTENQEDLANLQHQKAMLLQQGITAPPNPGNPSEQVAATPADTQLSQTTANQSIGSQTVLTPIGESAYPNILHDYSSYTYNISLHTVSIEQYNEFSVKPKTTYVPEEGSVLIATAGRWDNTTRRNKNFANADFFFEKLSFETVIGSTEYAQNSNVLSLDFTIVEPYGMTLANRLLDLASDYSAKTTNKGIQDNVLQIPYLLQIDFFGYDSAGNPQQMTEISKYIPIMITSIKFKISTSGSQWDFTAVPYNHQAFTETSGVTPMKCQVVANSLKEFFAAVPTGTESNAVYNINAVNAASTIQNKQAIASVDASRKSISAGYAYAQKNKTGTRSEAIAVNSQIEAHTVQPQTALSKVNMLVHQSSYPSAVNLWNQVNQRIGACKIADEIAFTIDPKFIDAKFQPQELINITSLEMAAANTTQANLAIQSGMITNIDDKEHPRVETTINQGTSILQVISTAMLNSDYIHNQIIDPSKDNNITVEQMTKFLSKPLDWFHIVPTVKILGYDTINNRYAKKITYNIQHKTLYQDKNKNASQGYPVVIAKDYEYLFTGKNIDIINFDLSFDSQFFVVNVANPANADAVSAASSSDLSPTQSLLSKNKNEILTSAQVAAILNDINANGMPELKPKVHLVATIPTTSATRGGKAEMVKQLERNILSTIAGDLVSVKLKIIGDPDFIKQDDVFYNPQDIKDLKYNNNANKTVTDKRRTPNRSIATDAEDLFVRLTFKTPVDYDKSGLATPLDSSATNKYKSSMFSGLYKITTVKNYFSGGKFEQELDLYHYNLQNTPGIDNNTNKTQSTARPKELATQNNGAEISKPTVTATVDAPTKEVKSIISNSLPVTSSVLLIAGQVVIPGQPLSDTQMQTISMLVRMGNTFPDSVMQQYNKQLSSLVF